MNALDQTTQLLNREEFLARLSYISDNWNQSISQSAVLFIQFKNINNIFNVISYEEEKIILAELARRAQRVLKNVGDIYRYRYDEFTILFNCPLSTSELSVKCRRLIETLSEQIHIEKRQYKLVINIGAANITYDAPLPYDFIQLPKIALKSLNISGLSNEYAVYSKDIEENYRRTYLVQELLPRALKNEEFTLNYQPKICARTGRITGGEALIRWYCPELGHVAPDEFIQIAEISGHIEGIGTWVLEESIKQTKKWTELDPEFRMSINVSAIQMDHPEFPITIIKLLEKYELDASSIELEITESVIMRDLDRALLIFNLFRHFGIELSLDDFGTGYSSLSYLKKLPFKSLKIDKSFIRDLHKNKSDRTIVNAISDIAENFGLEVIAEGVELESHIEILKTHKINQYQGFYFSKPVSADEFSKLLRDKRPQNDNVSATLYALN